MISRVFGTLVHDILNYDVRYEDIEFPKDAVQLTEKEKLFHTIEQIVEYVKCVLIYLFFGCRSFFFFVFVFRSRESILNLGVWMPADYNVLPPSIEMLGLLSTGRFGWFTPKQLIGTDETASIIPYTIFKNCSTKEFNRFLFDENVLKQL